MVFAALALAFLVQERHPEEAVQTRGDPLVNGNSGPVFTVMGVNGKTSTGEMTSGEAIGVDHTLTEIFPKDNPSS